MGGRSLVVDAQGVVLAEAGTDECTLRATVDAEATHAWRDRFPALGTTAVETLALHPLLNPAVYVAASVDDTAITVSTGAAHADGGWISLCGPGSTRPLQAAIRGVDPHLDVAVTGTDAHWTATVVRRDEPAPDFDEVAVTRVSTGVRFGFEPRRSLPITPV